MTSLLYLLELFEGRVFHSRMVLSLIPKATRLGLESGDTILPTGPPTVLTLKIHFLLCRLQMHTCRSMELVITYVCTYVYVRVYVSVCMSLCICVHVCGYIFEYDYVSGMHIQAADLDGLCGEQASQQREEGAFAEVMNLRTADIANSPFHPLYNHVYTTIHNTTIRTVILFMHLPSSDAPLKPPWTRFPFGGGRQIDHTPCLVWRWSDPTPSCGPHACRLAAGSCPDTTPRWSRRHGIDSRCLSGSCFSSLVPERGQEVSS